MRNLISLPKSAQALSESLLFIWRVWLNNEEKREETEQLRLCGNKRTANTFKRAVKKKSWKKYNTNME